MIKDSFCIIKKLDKPFESKKLNIAFAIGVTLILIAAYIPLAIYLLLKTQSFVWILISGALLLILMAVLWRGCKLFKIL